MVRSVWAAAILQQNRVAHVACNGSVVSASFTATYLCAHSGEAYGDGDESTSSFHIDWP
jgi:hypothetical protein